MKVCAPAARPSDYQKGAYPFARLKLPGSMIDPVSLLVLQSKINNNLTSYPQESRDLNGS